MNYKTSDKIITHDSEVVFILSNTKLHKILRIHCESKSGCYCWLVSVICCLFIRLVMCNNVSSVIIVPPRSIILIC